MNARELLQCAPRLSESNCAYVLYENDDRAIIVPPGASGKKITVRACDADGIQSGRVKKVSPKELRLEPLPAPQAPLLLAPWCVNCGNPAMLRCMACGSSICGVPCATERWKQHRPECRRLQAVAFGEEYAREKEGRFMISPVVPHQWPFHYTPVVPDHPMMLTGPHGTSLGVILPLGPWKRNSIIVRQRYRKRLKL